MAGGGGGGGETIHTHADSAEDTSSQQHGGGRGMEYSLKSGRKSPDNTKFYTSTMQAPRLISCDISSSFLRSGGFHGQDLISRGKHGSVKR